MGCRPDPRRPSSEAYRRGARLRRTRDISELRGGALKSRVLVDQLTPYLCQKCDNAGMWLNEDLVLHLDHADGDRTNNAVTNLRWLCPNCHSQTPTYCGRNRRRYKEN